MIISHRAPGYHLFLVTNLWKTKINNDKMFVNVDVFEMIISHRALGPINVIIIKCWCQVICVFNVKFVYGDVFRNEVWSSTIIFGAINNHKLVKKNLICSSTIRCRRCYPKNYWSGVHDGVCRLIILLPTLCFLKYYRILNFEDFEILYFSRHDWFSRLDSSTRGRSWGFNRNRRVHRQAEAEDEIYRLG